MPGLALAMNVDREALVARSKADRRKYRRVNVDLAGRLFVPEEGREEPCKILDFSPGGAQVACEFMPPVDKQIVLYVDGFGRFEGIVARPDQGRFGVKFNCSALKRERIAEQLMLYMNRGIVDASSLRRHDRAKAKGLASFTMANGDEVPCEVVDLSLSGVSLKTHRRPLVGEIVQIGQITGCVVRYHETGFAVEFVKPAAEIPRLVVSK